jgi:ubiquitin-conjugating enzyme E2 Q
LTIQQFLEYISDSIDDVVLGRGTSLDRTQHNATESDIFSDDDMDWELDFGALPIPATTRSETMRQIRLDLRLAKEAGYRVGHLGELTGSVIISISCRIAKLGISEVAMQAWNVRPSEYLVLLLRYPLGYRRLEQVIWKSTPKVPLIQMHVAVCHSYKPTLGCAIQAFVPTQADTSAAEGPTLQPLFIGDSLHALLNTHFTSLVWHRLQHGFTWTGAELYLNNGQGKSPDSKDLKRATHFVPETWSNTTPAFLQADHLSEGKAQLSLPLVAIQFTLRRVVKCTEFCLNCYCKVDAGFEALMPYVCSSNLCLYQYMKLGMGRSLEWEIISQPYVIDMLVSFTYARAAAGRLQDFPTGLGMGVPTSYNKGCTVGIYQGKLNLPKMELILEEKLGLKVGDWIVMTPCGTDVRSGQSQWHCRVQEAHLLPCIALSPPVTIGTEGDHYKSFKAAESVKFVLYKESFDDLSISAKCEAIVMLLDTLPAIDAMRSFILSQPQSNSKKPLAAWCERISPSALYVLRWIVASNRSCIMYESDPEHQISGLKGYAQFRLAQGAPDKEQRFVSAVRSMSSSHGLKYPTLFAWHGSPLDNWHSILREGLHFKTIAHGRAMGDGVYMSPQFTYSVGYAARCLYHKGWPNSTLNIQKAVALNEVVNAPAEFVHSSSCYVVKQLDWIQPRYLIIEYRNAALNLGDASVNPSIVYTQDPKHCALGPGGEALTIPISAVSSHQSDVYSAAPNLRACKKVRGSIHKARLSEDAALSSDEDMDSVATLAEDHELLESDAETFNRSSIERASEACRGFCKTDFRPGNLEVSSLKLLGPPTYATTLATKSVQKHLQATLKTQERGPLHELGWYIDPDFVNNVYQWIVQLHSFDPSLPLARDLKAAKLTDIVLELRFPPQFPMSPPFVRIIRPRFLPFSNGGGGHVTIGGAMCMELLTSSGWSPASSMESVLLQVRMALTSTDPAPARLEQRHTQDYSVGEAVASYARVCQTHGWKLPDDLVQVSW